MQKYLDYGFGGRSAIVTGAGTGIGASVAVELAKGGAKVALIGRGKENLLKVAEQCGTYTDSVLTISCDVSDPAAATDAAVQTAESFGGVDILINNAGIESRLKPGQTFFRDLFDKLEPDEYLSFFRVHALGHYLMNLAVIPYMQKKHFGRIVNTTSVTGLIGGYSTPAYTASKAAAICQTRAFALKYGPDNITVNSVAPGMVNTPMKIDATPEEFERVANKTPLRHVAEPIEVARTILFFAQEHLFVTGQTLVCDGGNGLY